MKTILTITITLLINACGSTTISIQEPATNITHSESIANCTEDYMDNATYPTDMSDMDSIDYVADEALYYCESVLP